MKVITDKFINESLQELECIADNVRRLNTSLSDTYAAEIVSNAKLIEREIKKTDDELAEMLVFNRGILDCVDRIMSTFGTVNDENRYIVEQLDKIRGYSDKIRCLKL